MSWWQKITGRGGQPEDPPVASPSVEVAPTPGTEPTWHPDPSQVAELREMRRRELLTISKRLGRVDRRQRAQPYEWAATLLIGGVIGGGFGLIPFLGQKPNPGTLDRLVYFGLLGVAAVVAYLCYRAAKDARAERSDTVAAVKEDLDQLLEGSLHE